MRCHISQVNLQHCKAATALISRRINSCKTFIYLIQEPWVVGGAVRGLNFQHADLLYANGSDRPRTCMVVSKDFQANLVNDLCDGDTTSAKLTIKSQQGDKEILWCSAYFPYDAEDVPSGTFIRAIQYAKSRGMGVIAGCDVNAHHICWGSSNINARGSRLLEYLVGTDLQILNVGNEPTFFNVVRREVIDITVASPDIAALIGEWRVSNDITLSDHRRIDFVMGMDLPPPTPFRNPRKTDWVMYQTELSARVTIPGKRIKSIAGIEKTTQMITTSMREAFEESCPLKMPKKGKTPWWNSDLAKQRRTTRMLLNRALKGESSTSWNRYKEAQKALKKSIRSAKRSSWRRFCEETNSLEATSKLKRILVKERSQKLGYLRLQNGKYTESDEETANHLLEVHFPGSIQNLISGPTGAYSPQPRDWNLACKVVSLERVKWAFNSFHRYKSAGPDGIIPALVIEGMDALGLHIRNIYRACLAHAYIPIKWRDVKVLFIPKPGKPTYTDAKSFRPISLTSFLLKGLERLVDRFIRDTHIPKWPLHHRQHAYQKGKSTETALHELTAKIEKAMSEKEYALGAFMDIEGAFNYASFAAICDAARQHGIEPLLISWILHMLEWRKIHISVGQKSIEAGCLRGCPQGGVLSPLLWLLVMDTLLWLLEDKKVFAQAFADDLAVIITGKFADTVCDRLNATLHVIHSWCLRNGLTVNARKTGLVMFTRNVRWGSYTLPTLAGAEIQLAQTVKYLGVHFDSKLTWKHHIQEQYQKSCRLLWCCRNAIGKTWGLSPKRIYWMYTSIIKPILMYACIVWWPRLNFANSRKLLTQIQRLGCLSITGAMSTTPTAALEAILNLPPIHLEVKRKAANDAYRLDTIGAWKGGQSNGHASIWKFLEKHPVALMPTDHMVSRFVFEKTYTVVITEREEWSTSGHESFQITDLIIFTDGSVTEDGSGAGVFSENPIIELARPLGKMTTIFQAEIYAISLAAEECLRQKWRGRTIRICSDSRAALSALNGNNISSQLVWSCHQVLLKLGRLNETFLMWVPGHSNIAGNEEADRLARRGSGSTMVGPEPALGIRPSTVKSTLKGEIARIHATEWRNLDSCRQAKILVKEPRATRAAFLLSLKKWDMKTLVGLLTGHCPLNYHMEKIGVVVSAVCSQCEEEEETALHFLCSCPASSDLRRRHLGKVFFNEESAHSLPLENVLRFAKACEHRRREAIE